MESRGLLIRTNKIASVNKNIIRNGDSILASAGKPLVPEKNIPGRFSIRNWLSIMDQEGLINKKKGAFAQEVIDFIKSNDYRGETQWEEEGLHVNSKHKGVKILIPIIDEEHKDAQPTNYIVGVVFNKKHTHESPLYSAGPIKVIKDERPPKEILHVDDKRVPTEKTTENDSPSEVTSERRKLKIRLREEDKILILVLLDEIKKSIETKEMPKAFDGKIKQERYEFYLSKRSFAYLLCVATGFRMSSITTFLNKEKPPKERKKTTKSVVPVEKEIPIEKSTPKRKEIMFVKGINVIEKDKYLTSLRIETEDGETLKLKFISEMLMDSIK